MKSKLSQKLLTGILSVAMMLNMGITPVFAATEGALPIGTSSVCTHVHDDKCGYTEGTAESPCAHTHTADCYSGELCKPKTPAPKCDCTVKCTLADEGNGVEESINVDCPVCATEGADLSECKGKAPMPMMAPAPRGTVTEQFTLATGQTYYFDLSAEKSKIGTINPAVPDTTLHYVPFTYTGTVNAYSLDSTSSGNTGASEAAAASDRSLFVADYNVSYTKPWNDLNTASLIFGKTFDTNYKLRSLSAGSSKIDTPLGGAPTVNEWDSILGKIGLTNPIKNWSNIYSFGQDTSSSRPASRAVRGSATAAHWGSQKANVKYTNFGWRPALEVLNPATLTIDGLKAVALNLNGGSFNSKTDALNIVCAGTTFKAPSGEVLTPPSGKGIAYFKWNTAADGNGTSYDVGASVPNSVTTLYAQWTAKATTTTATFAATGADSGTLSGLTAGASYKYSVNGGSTYTDFTGATATISSGITATNGVWVVKKGDGTTTTDSEPQKITVTKATAPTVGKTDETSAGNNGTITGVTTAMEYKLSTVSSYTAIGGTTVTGLPAGTYNVRVKATGTVLASADTSVTIVAFVKTTDLTYGLTAVDYSGSAIPVSVTAASGKNLGAIIVKYNGSTTAPTNAGTYAITVDTAGSAEYNAVTALSLGDFTINKVAYTGNKAIATSVFESGQAGTTVTLPTLPTGASYGTPQAGGTMTSMSISGTTLTYTAPASTAGQTGTMTIPVTGATNYNNYNVVVTVTYTAKTPQAISYANTNISKTYGDAKFTNLLTETTVNGTITYASDDVTVATVNSTTGEVTIVGYGTDGSATITATAAATATHAEATASYIVTVAKKALTLQEENKSMTKGGAVPSFGYKENAPKTGDTSNTMLYLGLIVLSGCVAGFGLKKKKYLSK